jgi:hypothetical protein
MNPDAPSGFFACPHQQKEQKIEFTLPSTLQS